MRKQPVLQGRFATSVSLSSCSHRQHHDDSMLLQHPMAGRPYNDDRHDHNNHNNYHNDHNDDNHH